MNGELFTWNAWDTQFYVSGITKSSMKRKVCWKESNQR
jgi:hypothetical protein